MAAQTQSQGGINQCSLYLAMELDGAQHVADAGAYRRDRRKDAMLQENGYMVLRFLAEDVGKRLDDVLNTILRALVRQRANPYKDFGSED